MAGRFFRVERVFFFRVEGIVVYGSFRVVSSGYGGDVFFLDFEL